jgi:hypothetical protein
MGSFYFAISNDFGYSIIRIEAEKLTAHIMFEAYRIAELNLNSKPLETELEISEAFSFQTNEGPFSFSVNVAPDRQSASYEIFVDGELIEAKTMQV